MRPPAGLTLLVGGARSGKSALAVQLAEGFDGAVVFVATALVGDDDMALRVSRHRAERPTSWSTIENPTFAAADVDEVPADSCIVLDCLTLWVNEMTVASDAASIVASATQLAATLAARAAPTIVVTNEVGLGIVPMNAMARQYRDILGNVNRAFAAASANPYFVSAGLLLPLQRPYDLFR